MLDGRNKGCDQSAFQRNIMTSQEQLALDTTLKPSGHGL